MKSRNALRIEYNPYLHEFKYARRKAGYTDWASLDSADDELRKEKFQRGALHVILEDLLTVINRIYNYDGFSIVFCSTERDCGIFREGVERFYSVPGMTAAPEVEYRVCYKSVKDVASQITHIVATLEKEFDEVRDPEVKELNESYKKAFSPTIPICLIGAYSSGKSTFLNALIGREILPSRTDPTTAKVFEVRNGCSFSLCVCGCDCELKCSVKDGRVVFANAELFKGKFPKLVASLGGLAGTSDESVFADMVDMVNAADKIGDFIRIEVPFVKSGLSLDDIPFVIYDTPGPDSVNNKEHREVLKEALSEQTNGLPIFVVNPDTLDKPDTKNILTKFLSETGQVLDVHNVLVVVNKAEDIESVADECKSVLSDWRSRSRFYVSSIIGLGAKKVNGVWRNKAGKRIYNGSYSSYAEIDDDSDMFLSLPYYNKHQLPRELYEETIAAVEAIRVKAVDTDDDSEEHKELVICNSGLRAVELAIDQFAHHHAWYNKCTCAIQYLAAMIELMENRLSEKDIDLQKSKKELDRLYEERYEYIQKQLTKLSSDFRMKGEEEQGAFVDEMGKSCLEGIKKKRLEKLDDMLDRLPGIDWRVGVGGGGAEENKSEKIKQCIMDQLQGAVDETQDALKYGLKQFWEKRSKDFCQRIQDEVTKAADRLWTISEASLQNLLQSVLNQSIDIDRTLVSDKIVAHNFFFLFHFVMVMKGELREQFESALLKARQSLVLKYSDECMERTRCWVTQIIEKLVKTLETADPELKALNDRIQETRDSILITKTKLGQLTDCQNTVQGLQAVDEETLNNECE